MRPGEESNIASVYQTETTGIEGELAETSAIANQMKVECEYFIALGNVWMKTFVLKEINSVWLKNLVLYHE